MKLLLYTAALFFCGTGIAAAQETMDRLDQQPQPVTQTQVERDSRLAQEERRKNEEAARREKERQQEKKTEEREKSIANTTNPRTSNSPGKQ